MNAFHDAIDLCLAKGKKLYQKATQASPNDQKHEDDLKDIIKFVERIKNKSKDADGIQ